MTQAVYEPNPIDMDDPVAISHRLGEIEDELAFVGNQLSRAAYWRTKYKGQIDLDSKMLYPDTVGTIPEREAKVVMILAGDAAELPQKLIEADATYAQFSKDFDTLDTRRSILQSALKVHTREQEPRFGNGSHPR